MPAKASWACSRDPERFLLSRHLLWKRAEAMGGEEEVPTGMQPEIWRAFYPNAHQMVVGPLVEGSLLKAIWVDLGPKRTLPAGLPKYFRSVKLTSGYINSMVELQGLEHGLWCFSTSRFTQGLRALTVGMYNGQWLEAKLAASTATDIYNLLHAAEGSVTEEADVK